MAMTIDSYLRSVEPGGGLASTVGAARGAGQDYAQSVSYSLEPAIRQTGGSLQRLGGELDRQRRERGALQSNMALMKFRGEIDESLRQYDASDHVDENKIPQWERDAEQSFGQVRQRRDAYLKSVPAEFQQEFTRLSEQDLQLAGKAFSQKARTHRLDLIRATVPEAVSRMYEDGDVEGALRYWAQTNRDYPDAFTEQEQARHEDGFEESVIFGRMRHDPDTVDRAIETATIPEERKRALRSAARADRESARRMAQEEQDRLIDANDNQVTLRLHKTVGGRATPEEEIMPSELDAMFARSDISKERYESGLKLLTEGRSEDRGTRLRAYAEMRHIVNELSQGQLSQKAAWGAYYFNADKLSEEDAEYFIDQITNIPTTTLGGFKKESLTIFDDSVKKMQDEGKLGQMSEMDIGEAKGRAAKRIDTWSDQTFPEDEHLDRTKFLEGALGILLEERDQLTALNDQRLRESIGKGKKKGPKAPAGFEDIWADFTDEQKRQIERLSSEQRRIFLERYKAGRSRPQAPPEPGPIDVPDIPTATMLGQR